MTEAHADLVQAVQAAQNVQGAGSSLLKERTDPNPDEVCLVLTELLLSRKF
jgi:hypothetical protein